MIHVQWRRKWSEGLINNEVINDVKYLFYFQLTEVARVADMGMVEMRLDFETGNKSWHDWIKFEKAFRGFMEDFPFNQSQKR